MSNSPGPAERPPWPSAGPARLHMLQRTVLLAGLVAMLWAMTAQPGGAGLHGAGLRISVVLAIASVSWLALALIGPHGNTLTLRAVTACTAISGSVLLLLYPGLAVYWFTFWACVSAGINFSLRTGAAITSVSAAILIVGDIDHRGSILGAFAAVAFVGYVLGRNRRHYVGLASQATLAANVREREAALAERERIARELHDVLGHSLTGASLQIESAAAALESAADPDQALTHLERASELVRTGQEEAVAAVRTLRDTEISVDTGVAELAAKRRADGMPVECAVSGSPRPLGLGQALALYRVTQEALTNAAKHAPGMPVVVRLFYTADAVTVSVVNETSDCGRDAPVRGGHGLVGMRERMAEAGGTLSAGAVGVGTLWQVEARIAT